MNRDQWDPEDQLGLAANQVLLANKEGLELPAQLDLRDHEVSRDLEDRQDQGERLVLQGKQASRVL